MQDFFQKKPGLRPGRRSEPEIAFSFFNLLKIFPADLSCLFSCDILELSLDHFIALFFCFRAGVVFQILFQRHQGVGMTAVSDLA